MIACFVAVIKTAVFSENDGKHIADPCDKDRKMKYINAPKLLSERKHEEAFAGSRLLGIRPVYHCSV
jgi:hypothetical protein